MIGQGGSHRTRKATEKWRRRPQPSGLRGCGPASGGWQPRRESHRFRGIGRRFFKKPARRPASAEGCDRQSHDGGVALPTVRWPPKPLRIKASSRLWCRLALRRSGPSTRRRYGRRTLANRLVDGPAAFAGIGHHRRELLHGARISVRWRVRSSSQERTTLPWRHSSAIASGRSAYRFAGHQGKPSA